MPPHELIDAAIELLIYAVGALVIIAGIVSVGIWAIIKIIKAVRRLWTIR